MKLGLKSKGHLTPPRPAADDDQIAGTIKTVEELPGSRFRVFLPGVKRGTAVRMFVPISSLINRISRGSRCAKFTARARKHHSGKHHSGKRAVTLNLTASLLLFQRALRNTEEPLIVSIFMIQQC